MKIAGASSKLLQPKIGPQSSWFTLMIVLLASVAAPLNQFKVPPVMPLLMKAFHQSPSQAGLLMSVFALTGLILAIPTGLMIRKLGYRAAGFAAIFALILGAGVGALSKSMEAMLVSRFIEGAGLSFMSVVAPTMIALWFSAEKRGKAMGIWAVWVPLGSTIMFTLAPFLAGHWGWQGVWWFGFFYALAVGLLFYLFVKSNPESSSGAGRPSPVKYPWKEDLNSVLRHRDLWLISTVFYCFNFVYIAFITWAPTFLVQIRHSSMARSDLLVSLTSILAIAAGPTAGWISDKIHSRKAICAAPLIFLAFLFPLIFRANENLFLGLAVAIGFFAGFIPTGVFSAGVEVVGDERLAGMAMAIVQIGQNLGILAGPLIFGWMVEGWGWQTAFWILIPVSISGAISGWLAKMR